MWSRSALDGYAAGDDPTWGDQPDRLLVIRQLMMWATARHRLEEASTALLQVCGRLSSSVPLDLIDVVWCYSLVCSSDRRSLPVDHDELRRLAEGAIAQVTGPDDDLTRGQAGALAEAMTKPEWPITVG